MWVLLAFVLALVLIYLEFFLPGGILGTMGALSLLASIVLGFWMYGGSAGLVIMVGELMAGFALLAFGLKMFPETRVGKRMILGVSLDSTDGYTGETQRLKALLGKHGTADTDLRPAGVVRIESKRVDAVTDGEYVDRGTPIAVTEVEGNRVVVRRVEVEQTPPAAEPGT